MTEANHNGPSDVPGELTFVDPAEAVDAQRVVLWGAAGTGKSVAASSAPTPILVLSADRPSAYRFARRHHGHDQKALREVRYRDASTLSDVFRYLRDHPGEVRTIIIDPVHNIYERLVDTSPLRGDGEPDYQAVNKKLLGFLYELRQFDLNVVLVAHEKLNDGKRGDGKLYPQLGGPALTNKILAEMDIVARVGRVPGEGDEPTRWLAQLQPIANWVCKEGTGVLGDRREPDLSEWFRVVATELAPDVSDLPWEGPADDDIDPADPGGELDLADAKAAA